MEIKQINTGVAEIIAVKVPEGAYDFLYHDPDWQNEYNVVEWKEPLQIIGSFHKYQGAYFIDDDYDYEILGLSNELTEEQCMAVVPFEEYFDSDDASLCGDEYEPPILFMEFKHKSIKNNPFKLETAKEAFASLMQANGINEPHLILKRLS